MANLRQGDRVAVIGGGPAGSFFALHLIHQARQRGLELDVCIYEPRDFTAPGPAGCNRCAGILSSRLVHGLARLNVLLPETVIHNRISSYCLHTPHGTVEVPQPHPHEPILTVFRGTGPRRSGGDRRVGFDQFLLDEAESRGARRIAAAVEEVGLDGIRPKLRTGDGECEADLLVLAAGVNTRLMKTLPGPYLRPPTLRMAQDEVWAGADAIRERLGNWVHVFLQRDSGLVFGTLVPKGDFISVTLLSSPQRPVTIQQFLEHPQVRRWLPEGGTQCCGCRPRIPLGPARQPYGERLVAIGDAAVCRLYKDGIGSAFRTARAAARTAVQAGVGAREFRRHYLPVCRDTARDNTYGRMLFGLQDRIKGSRRLFTLQAQVMLRENNAPYPDRHMDQINWGMFTGAHSYRRIFRKLFAPRLWLSFAAAGASLMTRRPQEETVARSIPTRRVLILGGGFAGVPTALRLEKLLGSDRSVSITLVSDENYTLFTPLLSEVATGGIETRHIAAPIRRLSGHRRFDFIQSRVKAIDLDRRQVSTSCGTLDYDVLVLALGSVTDQRAIRGKEKHVLGLKTLQDGIVLRNHIIRMFETASAQPQLASELLTFVVVGGGITGVQLAADVNHFVRNYLPRDYVRIHPDRTRVLLVQDDDSVLPEWETKMANAARRALEGQGVEVFTGAAVTDVGPEHVAIGRSVRVSTRSVIWTPGVLANPVVAALDVPKDARGRVHAEATMALPGHPEVFALGDNAHIVDPNTGGPLPATAHIAIRQPKVLAPNIAAFLGGGELKPYRYSHMGQLVSLGPRDALADIYGYRFKGFASRVLWAAAYSGLMTGRYNQARVLTDWALGLVFGRDSTLLRRF